MKWFVIISFICLFWLITHIKNLLTRFSPLKTIVGKVNLPSIHTNFAPIEIGKLSWYFIVYSPSEETVRFKKYSLSAYVLNGIGTCFS